MYGNINGGWPGSDLGQPLGSNKAKHLTGPAVFQQEGDRSLQGVGLTWQQGHPLGAHIVYSAMDMLDVDGNDVTSLVRTGDRLMEIDGFNVTTHQTAIVEKMVVGERNSAVEMTFLSANSGMLVVLRIRRHVPPPPAQAFLDRDDEEQVPPASQAKIFDRLTSPRLPRYVPGGRRKSTPPGTNPPDVQPLNCLCFRMAGGSKPNVYPCSPQVSESFPQERTRELK